MHIGCGQRFKLIFSRKRKSKQLGHLSYVCTKLKPEAASAAFEIVPLFSEHPMSLGNFLRCIRQYPKCFSKVFA